MPHDDAQEPRWPRRIAVLGSTGSIGRSALDVISRVSGRFEVTALAAGSNAGLLAEQAIRHRPRYVALASERGAAELRDRLAGRWAGEIGIGEAAVEAAASVSETDVVLNGLVGAAGLRPTWLALRAGATVALANKESLVIAGEFLTAEARRFGGRFLPVDSEHSGLFQCLDAHRHEEVARIVLTASGGPFRTRPIETFEAITPAEALCHPTWKMGPRITVDSATLLNKGFEVLEARWLFDVPEDRIEVWIHPQSIVHGFVEWVDGSTTAQMSVPDMRIPILYALAYPHRLEAGLPRCDLTAHSRLDFAAPDPARYPCLELARRALREGGTAAAVLNAADEVVVGGFLEGRLPFPRIPALLSEVMDQRPPAVGEGLEAVREADRWAREEALRLLDAAG